MEHFWDWLIVLAKVAHFPFTNYSDFGDIGDNVPATLMNFLSSGRGFLGRLCLSGHRDRRSNG